MTSHIHRPKAGSLSC